MNKIKLIIALLLFTVTTANSQDTICASIINLPLIQQNNPDRYQRIMALEQHTQNYINSVNNGTNNARLIQPNATIIIPVVVHILHRGEPVGTGRNISDAQILSQIDVLNEDFRRLNADRVNTPAAFQPVAGDPNFEFRLACIDPNENPTNGITRTFANRNQFFPLQNINPQDGSINEQATGIKFTAQGGTDAWATDRYLNIWVCDMGNGLIGYGQFPDEYPVKANTDGVVMLFNAFGRVGNVLPGLNLGRVTCHEVGHWLNLRHIWGDANCGNDFVDDTPTQQTANRGCPGFPHITCSNGPNGDMFMNYMDYTENGCQNIFTNGQNLRMRAIFAQGGPRAAFIDNYFRVNEPTAPICTSGNVTAQNLSCLPITWSVVSKPATIIGGQNTNTVTLQQNGNGTAVIRATAGGFIDETNVIMGTPVPTIQYVTYYGNEVGLTALSIPNATYNWYEDGILTEAGTGNSYITTVPCNTTKFIQVEAVNTCGTSIKAGRGVSVKCSTGGAYSLAPNPASSNLTISVNEPVDKTNFSTTTEIQEVRITDKLGNLKANKKYQKGTKSVNINVASLKSDMYIVQIFNGTNWDSQQLVIQH